MESQSQGGFYLDDDERVPLRVRRKVLEQMKASELDDTKRASRQALALDRIVRAARKEMRSAIGARKFAQYRDAIGQRREKLRLELENARDAGMSADQLTKLGARRRRETNSIVKRLGINTKQLEDIARQAHRKADAVFEKPRGRGGRPGRLVLPDDVPRDIIEMKTNPWTIVSPPYAGWWSLNNAYNSGGFSLSDTLFTNKDTGMAGVRTRITDYDIDFVQFGYYDFTTSVGFWYKTPKSGLIEVWIKGQCAKARHSCWLLDEFGFSNSAVHQVISFTLRVWDENSSSWGGPSDVLLSHWYEKGYTDGSWSIQWLTSGGTYWGHLFSDLSYSPNKWVWISVGTNNWNRVSVTDVEVDSTLDTRWFIEQVFVESTG